MKDRILRDGDTVLFSAIATRRKVLNLARELSQKYLGEDRRQSGRGSPRG